MATKPMGASKPMAFVVRPRGQPIKNLPEETYAYPSDTGKDIYERIAAKSRFPIDRLRITKGYDGSLIPNSKDVTVDAIGIYDESELIVKDLGPQIAWRTVFVIEYLGPLLIHPLIYFLRSRLYQNPSPPLPFPAPSASATLSFYMIMIHFLKREFETLFVHRFSNATMPAFNILKNSAHYWLLAGLNIALCTYAASPSMPAANPAPRYFLSIATALFAVGELGNLWTHLTLRNLRSQGGTERGIPVSGAFKFVPVTCPNYFFETVAWAGIWMANRSLSTGLFAVIAVVQMALWARKKEAKYRREFGSKYKRKRFAMLPGIV